MPPGVYKRTAEHIATVKKNLPSKEHLKNGSFFPCLMCGKPLYKTLAKVAFSKSKNFYCSVECMRESPNRRSLMKKAWVGREGPSKETRLKISETLKKKWEAGVFLLRAGKTINRIKPVYCRDCGKEISRRRTYCASCKTRHWSPAHRRAIAEGASKSLRGKMPKNTMREGAFMNVKRGFFDINGVKIFLRSTWEANYALYLDFLKKRGDILSWEYEAEVFTFDKIKRGTTTYRPDFKVTDKDGLVEFHEVKGWMTPKSVTQIKRMKKYFPYVVLILITSKEYRELKNKMGSILGFF